MKTRNIVSGTGAGATVIQGGHVSVRLNAKQRAKMEYPTGAIGADLVRRNYIRYLTARYHRYREAEVSFGPKAVRKFSYAVLFKTIEARFRAPTYFISVDDFDKLVDFLHQKIDGTILGKRNRARGIRNYDTFDEFQVEKQTDA